MSLSPIDSPARRVPAALLAAPFSESMADTAPLRALIEHYDEMHVDGGTASQVFVYPAAIDWPAMMEKLHTVGEPRVFVIRNDLDLAYIPPGFSRTR